MIDRYIVAMPYRIDDDLCICDDHGIAYQRDMTITARYDRAYFDKCDGYKGQTIAQKINAGRVELVNDFVGDDRLVLDIGIGSGEFILSRMNGGLWRNTAGYDINPVAEEWLRDRGLWSDDFTQFRAFTMWDVIEHVPVPEHYFKHMRNGSFLFMCLPIFEDLSEIRKSKHYRPGEHLYYFTESGFGTWLRLYGFQKLHVSDYETRAGRESILSFAFRRGKNARWST